MLEIAALGMVSTLILKPQRHPYAPGEGHASHEKFSPIRFSFLSTPPQPKSSLQLLTFLKNFLSIFSTKSIMNFFTT